MVAGPDSTPVCKPGLYRAQGTGSCKGQGTGSCFTMYRAQDRAIPPRKGFTSSAWSLLRSYAQGTGFTGSAPVFHPMKRAQDLQQVTFLLHYAQGTGSCKPSPPTRVNLMHRAEDSLVPLGLSLDPMHRAQDSRVPRRFSNLCTVYRIYYSRHSSSMHRAVVPRVPLGHSLDPMHRVQFS